MVASMPRQCLKVIVSQTVKWAKSPGQTSGWTDKQTNRQTNRQTFMISLKMHPIKRSKDPVDMKSMIIRGQRDRQTDRHTKNNTASAFAGCKNQTFKNPRWRTAAILKIVKHDISATI